MGALGLRTLAAAGAAGIVNRSPARETVFPPRSQRALLRGVDTLVEAIRPTLGPLPRAVAVAPLPGSRRPIELLDDGGLVARRMVALPDRDEDAGAMLVRHVVWRVRERVGDGSATTAVLFRAVFAAGVRAIEAGADPARLRSGLKRGEQIIVDQLARSAQLLDGREALSKIAESLCGDAPLAAILSEAFDVVGVDGGLEIRPALDRGVDREYVEGAYWDGGLLARGMGPDGATGRIHLRDAAIVGSDLEIDALPELVTFLRRAQGAGVRCLILVARRLSERSLGLLLTNYPPGIRNHETGAEAGGDLGLHVVAVRTPGATPEEQFTALQDLALLCGGRPVLAGAGQTLSEVTPADLGLARRAWATQRHFGVAGGGGDPEGVRRRIQELRQAIVRAATVEEQESLRQRAGKLMAKTAIVRVGGATERESQARRERARRTAVILRGVLRNGLVPGGGVALLSCRERLAWERDDTDDPDEKAAFAILLAAVEAPFRAIVANAGHDPELCLNAVAQAPPGHGFNAICGEVVEMIPAGIADAASVQQAAVESAISAAALACTIGVLVHTGHREESALP